MSDIVSKKDKKESKKDKKEKKQQQEQQQEQQEEAPTPTDKKDKKDKKESKKRALPEDVVEETPAPVNAMEDTVEVSEKKSKKEKKEKKEKKSKGNDDNKDAESNTVVSLGAPTSAAPSKDLIEKFYADNHVKVTPNTSSKDANILPALTFAQTNFPEDVLAATKKFEKPSPIQAASWPVLQRGLDIISIAETGSGKTLGFLLPALCHIKNNGFAKKKGTPSVLVIAPTRELAIQIQQVAQECEQYVRFRSVCVYGGMDKRDQLKAMNDKVDIITATPGRLLGMIRDKLLDLSQVNYFVLDEADRLLDMGFEQDIRDITAAVKPLGERQTVLFSATWPESVMRFASTLIREKAHYRIDIGKGSDKGGDQLQANNRIKQTVFVVEFHQKKDKLKEIILQQVGRSGVKAIVFVLYKKEVPQIAEFLERLNCKVAAISSDYTQTERMNALDSFKQGKVDFLVATDVAARGLDIPNVEHVVNYTFPLTIEDYVHRIGRTGRAGKTGNAWTLFNAKDDKQHAGSLQLIMKKADQEVPEDLAKFGMVIKKKVDAMYGNFKKDNVDVTKKKHIKFDD